MPKLSLKLPRYRRHSSRNLGFVEIQGKRTYFPGAYNSAESREAFRRHLVTWESQGRPATPVAPVDELTITELLSRYLRHAESYYRRPDGTSTGTAERLKPTLRLVKKLFGHTLVKDFSPKCLDAVRHAMIGRGNSRQHINGNIGRLKAVFRWGAAEELCPLEVVQRLELVRGLAAGRSPAKEARDGQGVLPVSAEAFDATLPFLPPVVADLARFMRATGCRPGEAFRLRPEDVDTSGEIWLVRLRNHKNAHRGKSRTLYLGAKAREIVAKYLADRRPDEFMFSPAEGENLRRRKLSEARATPLNKGNRPGSKKPKTRRTVRDHYTKDSFNRAVARACGRAFPHPTLSRRAGETAAAWKARLSTSQRVELAEWNRRHRWHGNQIRHLVATEVRHQFGCEHAQVLLGHSRLDTTQIYALASEQKALEVARTL